MNKVYEVFRYLPNEISSPFRRSSEAVLSAVTDIRLKVDCPIIAYAAGKRYFLTDKGLSPESKSPLCLFAEDASFILMKLSNNSLYAYDESIKRGYITTYGGHRVGITGTATVNGGKIGSVRDICGFYFRIARDVRGCASPVYSSLIDCKGRVNNVLIVSPPGQGKTTLLRDSARYVSELGFKVCVVDERSEISMSDRSVLPYCAVLDGYPKGEGIVAGLRALSPDVIVIDEIGGRDDINQILQGLWAGTAFFATAHGKSVSDLMQRDGFSSVIPYFDVCLMPSLKDGKFFCDSEFLKSGVRI
jgi:stage III sporulation protein AA